MKKRSSRSERGAVAIEYGLIAALVVVAMIPAIQYLGSNTNGMYNIISTKVNNAIAR
jgi:pilus assembly protein Flp/PilA